MILTKTSLRNVCHLLNIQILFRKCVQATDIAIKERVETDNKNKIRNVCSGNFQRKE